jgi:hypothetical protein
MAAATAAITLPFHKRRAEGVNMKTKMIKRQMYGRAAALLESLAERAPASAAASLDELTRRRLRPVPLHPD